MGWRGALLIVCVLPVMAAGGATYVGAAACNQCHQATKHEFIVIQRPTSSPYSNQSFTPKK